MTSWWERKSGILGLAAAVTATGVACGGGTNTVEIVEDPVLETAFETVLINGEPRTVGDVAETASIGGGWDRMYYFRVPLLMSEVNRSIGTESTIWKNLPTTGADGVIIFLSGNTVVRAVLDHAPSLDLHGYATADSAVTANPEGANGAISVEAKGR
ncbi:hypothetical protein ACFWDA_04880 [Rhodococcus zopfii]|uniref:hypothetical protein n=1 Tax=Rhodococcus zopfii TaxID=43772 RepID=UPI0009F89865|nr:hypothetical protein [Rhodococcus zopfii]